jgi:hypothetical protein
MGKWYLARREDTKGEHCNTATKTSIKRARFGILLYLLMSDATEHALSCVTSINL